MKVANYCHHCPWKCITPHLRAHSIKETEGAINRWLLTSTHRKQKKLPKKRADSNQHFSFGFVQTFLLLTSNLGASGWQLWHWDLEHWLLPSLLANISDTVRGVIKKCITFYDLSVSSKVTIWTTDLQYVCKRLQ